MAYNKQYPKPGDDQIEWNTKQEDRIKGTFEKVDEKFSSYLKTIVSGYTVEFGDFRATPSSPGYVAHSIDGYMTKPGDAILLCNTKGYSYRDYTVNGYTVSGNNRLLQFWVFDKNGRPVETEVTIQYVVIYK